QMVDRSEPRYHDFAVEVMSKALRPADFAPHKPEAPAKDSAAPAAINLGGASFLFTGKMATMPRKDAEDRVKQLGGAKASSVAPGSAQARRGEFARKYILRHHPEIGPAKTDRPVDPGAEIPHEFLTFDRVQPLFAETRKPLRDFAVELARWEFARWKPPAEVL